ncbi:peptidase [Thermoleptolyngbya oregonensis NK1-22]|uniref:Peptidase n=1 Tax=Thermoleptolyngbya oregonensis NK1-22 TaxID=2547457 RepID=A0AA96YBH4_9CYAN|nr:peptidase [Thermoleptolyngbya sp. M55_K2018_002]WOB44618.1 peptidase [Thermoleptolyngbya oregonensis NK1-22]HIK41411.1 peptidase [Thermoleptolyngbya sp. M55_K2018_002]
MKRAFRKYHRLLAIALCLPLGLTVLSGIAVTLVAEWGLGGGLISRSFLLSLHTGEIFHLEAIYPLLDGVGLVGLLATGLSMTGLFHKKHPTRRAGSAPHDD